MYHKGFILICITIVFSVLSAGICQAGETWWQHDPATPGDWFVPANWTAGVPDSSDYAYIDNAGTAEIGGSDAHADRLYVGRYGQGTLNITNGGAVSNNYYCYIGCEAGSTGVVTVNGIGSTWTNSNELYVGYEGQGTLNITNGGAVSNNYHGYIGCGAGSTGVVTVTGVGSTWTSDWMMYIGYNGNATLDISNGGSVSSVMSYIAYKSGSECEVTVTGAGSTWRNSDYLCVGYEGTGTLNILDGALVRAETDIDVIFHFIGRNSGSSGSVTVTGAGSALTGNSRIKVGYYGTGTLEISDGGIVSSYSGGIGSEQGSDGFVRVTDAGSAWNNATDLCVGLSGTGRLEISDGAVVSSSGGQIGTGNGSEGVVLITGDGSMWNNSGSLYVGGDGIDSGGTGELTVGSGGSVWVGGMLKVWDTGIVNITNGGIVNVTGQTLVVRNDGAVGEMHFEGGMLTTGSLLAEPTQLTGTGTINTHGLVSDVDLLFDSTHGLNQTLTFDSQPGQNITINLTQNSTGCLGAGYAGNGTLAIREGVSVEGYYGYIGYYSGSTGVVKVDGSGSTWTSDGWLYVGRYGHGTLNITNGGVVSNTSSRIGYKASSISVVTVDGSGSTWTNSDKLIVGYKGRGTLNITNGGAVSNTNGYIGSWYSPASVVTVDGSGSVWTNSGDLYVGGNQYDGQGTSNITNGGAVHVTGDTWVAKYAAGEIHFEGGTLTTGSLFVGPTHLTGTGTINTHGLVSDVDLLFDSTHGPNQTFTLNSQPGQNITINLTQDNTGNLGAGYTGNGTLAIRDGVSVESCYGYIGYKAGANGVVTVDGSGSTWTNSKDLYVGYLGHGTLNITNGGAVISNNGGYIGRSSTSTGEVTVDGSGSAWTNSKDLYVGYLGHGTLNITNGGAVSNTDGYIGYRSTGVVTVDGSGSTWTNSGDLYIGGGSYYYSNGTGELTVSNGGVVNVTGDTWVAKYGGTGEIHFDSGTLTTESLFVEPTQLTGTGTINTHGLISDVDLLFDSTHGLNQTLTLNSQPDQNITINLNQSSMGNLGAGYAGNGTLAIRDGVSVECSTGYIGYKLGSTGVVTVAGSGSTWTCDKYLYIGYEGQGTLNITNGGVVSNSHGFIGYEDDSTGVVTVDGSGSAWTNSGSLYVGGNQYSGHGNGTLNITNGGAVSNNDNGYIGYRYVSTGVVTINGVGSTWTNSDNLYVGLSGQGTLNITNGGAVNVTGDTFVTVYYGAVGEIHFDGGTLTTESLLAGTTQLTGTGVINTHGLVSDVDLLFDSAHGPNQTLTLNSQSGQNITINLTQDSTGYLGAGYAGNGTLAIRDGVLVESSDGYIGYKTWATGVVTVDGSGSTWTNSSSLYVGGSADPGGTGVLTVSNGGIVEVGGMLKVWGGGMLNIGAAGQVNVGGMLLLRQDSTLTANVGATIHMTGSAFENESTNSANLAGLGNLTMIFEGGSEDIDPFEVAGEDMGAIMAGYDDNFALSTLQLGGADSGYVQLVDDYDNRPDWEGSEALYVENLILGAGSTLDLNGLNLYYLNFSDNGGTVLNGTPTQVPEPVSAVLLLSGGILVMFRRRRK